MKSPSHRAKDEEENRTKMEAISTKPVKLAPEMGLIRLT